MADGRTGIANRGGGGGGDVAVAGALRDFVEGLLLAETVDLGGGVPAFPGPAAPAEPPPPRPELHLSDLLTDAAGEAVLLPGDGQSALTLVGAEPVTGRGHAAPHLTATGEDVSGLSYVSFASGLTLYYPAELDVSVASG